MHLSFISRDGDCQQQKFFAQPFPLLMPLIPAWEEKCL